MVHDMINLSFIVKFAKQVFNILQKGHKFSKNRGEKQGEKIAKVCPCYQIPCNL